MSITPSVPLHPLHELLLGDYHPATHFEHGKRGAPAKPPFGFVGRGGTVERTSFRPWPEARDAELVPTRGTAAVRHNFCTQIISFGFLSLNFCWPRTVLVPAPEFFCGVFTLLARSLQLLRGGLGILLPRSMCFGGGYSVFEVQIIF